jgi:hypothetical protein
MMLMRGVESREGKSDVWVGQEMSSRSKGVERVYLS